MIWNVSDVLTAEGITQKRQLALELSEVAFAGRRYPVTEKSPVSLSVTGTGKGRAELTGRVDLTVTLQCDRCLKEVPYPFSLELSGKIVSPELGAEGLEDEADEPLGCQIDVDDLVYHEMSIRWPMKVLCSPDCKGICSVCGKDLNEGACGCDSFVPDPRWAAIRNWFDAGKEV